MRPEYSKCMVLLQKNKHKCVKMCNFSFNFNYRSSHATFTRVEILSVLSSHNYGRIIIMLYLDTRMRNQAICLDFKSAAVFAAVFIAVLSSHTQRLRKSPTLKKGRDVIIV